MVNGGLWLSIIILMINEKNVPEKKEKRRNRAKRQRENPVDTVV